jgi:hypothetical protein
MKTLLISFYSDIDNTTYYSDHSSRLKKECNTLGIPNNIQGKESLGSYQLNCLSKPQFILDMMEQMKQSLLWMDIDSLLHKPLDIFDHFDESVDMVVATANGRLSGMKASPLYFGNTDKAKEFVKAWIQTTKDILENKVGVFDHEPLFGLISTFIDKMKIQYVGPEYCIWPGHTNENTVVTMGLADADSKKESLRGLGMAEDLIEWQTPGNKL